MRATVELGRFAGAADGSLSLTISGGPAARGAGPPADVATTAESALTDIVEEHFS